MPQINRDSGQPADLTPAGFAGRNSARRIVACLAIAVAVCVLGCLIVRDVRAAKKLELIVAAAKDYDANVLAYAGRFEASYRAIVRGKSQDSEMAEEKWVARERSFSVSVRDAATSRKWQCGDGAPNSRSRLNANRLRQQVGEQVVTGFNVQQPRGET